MDKYSKAVAQMRKEGVDAYENDGRVFLKYATELYRYCQIEVSEVEVNKWASLYDDENMKSEVRKIKDADPYETLEEIARIFHYRGWHLGDGSAVDTDFIKSSDDFLRLVYQAFNPNNKK